MRLKENATAEKLRGSYYTQRELADYIVNWVMRNENVAINNILEPSCGDGVFLECLRERNLEDKCKITAIEIDREAAILASNRINETRLFNNYEEFECERVNILNDNLDIVNGCTVINDDFYKIYENFIIEERFQAIVGNPPYIRYQYLTETQREKQSSILTSNAMKSNKLINAWVSFVVACVQMLDNNGRIGLVIPAELLQVAYAKDLRSFLMSSLQKITIVTFKELVFQDVQQEVVLLLGEKYANHNDEHKIRIVEYQNVNQLIEDNNIDEFEFNNVVKNESKWTKYFLTRDDVNLIDSIREDDRFIKFSEMARIEVGITTGNNDYFCANRNIVEEYNLESVCKPLIARSVNINGVIFTQGDWQENIDKGAKTYLIDFPDVPYEDYSNGHKKYIEYGEKNKENTGYKCGIRDRWYRVPSIWSPDAFFLRRNHLYPKFMLNSQEVTAVSTDTMHRVRFNDCNNSRRAILAYYNSISLAFTEIEGRSYGGGVLEILPGEVSKIIIPDLRNHQLIDDDTVDKLVEFIDNYVRNNNDILGILDEIDRSVLIDIVGISEDIVLSFRRMWLTLRDRRLSRGARQS